MLMSVVDKIAEVREITTRELNQAIAVEIMGHAPRVAACLVSLCYAEDGESASRVEREIEAFGLGAEYVKALCELVWPHALEAARQYEKEFGVRAVDGFYDNCPEDVFRLFRASPEERCRAALAAVRRAVAANQFGPGPQEADQEGNAHA